MIVAEECREGYGGIITLKLQQLHAWSQLMYIYSLSLSQENIEQGSEKGLWERGFESHSAAMQLDGWYPIKEHKKVLSFSINLQHFHFSSPSWLPTRSFT